jgi:hypothetical protein
MVLCSLGRNRCLIGNLPLHLGTYLHRSNTTTVNSVTNATVTAAAVIAAAVVAIVVVAIVTIIAAAITVAIAKTNKYLIVA